MMPLETDAPRTPRPDAPGQGPPDEGGRIHYVTYFDAHYASRGLALHESLVRHSPPFVLWVLCLDARTEQSLERLDLPSVRCIPLSELEAADPGLLPAKADRARVEYYWTCGPALLLHVLRKDPRIQRLTYLDADLLFFSTPAPIYEEMGDRSILVIEHRYLHREPGDQRHYNRFNVGLLVFRRTAEGLACLGRWRDQCITWCYDRMEGPLCGDQGYLEEWPDRYQGLCVLQHVGSGVAPWNLRNAPFRLQGGQVRVGGVPLVFYHFSGLRRVNAWLYELHAWRFHHHRLDPVVRVHVYAHYVRQLGAAERRLRQVGHLQQDRGFARRSAEWWRQRRRLISAGNSSRWSRYQRFMVRFGRWVF